MGNDLYRRWRIEASIQTVSTIEKYIRGVLTDCLHCDGGTRLMAQAAACCAMAAMSAFENGTMPITYEAANMALGEIKAHWIDGK